ncbi:transposase [Paraburkholderia dilworthii]|uniref:transposase n=1 Tax=Paraburkholderia dilworthii TaxID=948106 RepID=UPI0009FEA35F
MDRTASFRHRLGASQTSVGHTSPDTWPPGRDIRLIPNAILWITQNDERWHRLPLTFPSPQTCYAKFLAWRRRTLLQQSLNCCV